MSRRYFLLFLWTRADLRFYYTLLKDQICACFLRACRISLQRYFLIKVERKRLSCDFSTSAGFSKVVHEEKEQCCEQGGDFNSESRARRSRGSGSKRDLYVGNRKDPLSTRAAHPVFWGYAINKATVGPPVLLSLAICCLSWLLHCQAPALTLSSFTDWCYKGPLWLQHAGDCLPPVQFGNGTPEPLCLPVN